MDKIIEYIATWLNENYPQLLIVIGAIIVSLYIIKEIKEIFFTKDNEGYTFGTNLKYFIFFWLKRKQKKEDPKNIIYTDEEREKIISKLLIHNFFISINNIKTNINFMDFGSTKKSAVFRDSIRIYVECIEKAAEHIIRDYKLDEYEVSKLNQILMKQIESTESEIYGKMRNRLGDDLYNLIIDDPIKGFRTKNSIFREIFINGVLLISSQAMSVYHYDNYERASEILTSMYISMQVIVKNFEKVFHEFNGEIDKLLK